MSFLNRKVLYINILRYHRRNFELVNKANNYGQRDNGPVPVRRR